MPAKDQPSQKVVLVTGASGGIGLAICEVLAARRYAVVAGDLDPDPVSRFATSHGAKQKIVSIRADVSDPTDCAKLVDSAITHFGKLDVLVNNAGICPRLMIGEVTEESFDRIVGVNLKGCFFLSQKASSVMKQQRAGRIINMASVSGRVGGAIGASVYSATKGGILALTKSFARELAPFNILVNAVAPGAIDTHLITSLPPDQQAKLLAAIPMSRLGRPMEVANVVAFLSSEEANYITGATIDINGGWVMY